VAAWSFGKSPAGASPAGPPPAAASSVLDAPGSSTPPNWLAGVYAGYKYINVTVLGVLQRKAVNDYFSFFRTAVSTRGLPQSGLVNFNPERTCQNAVEFCGTYQVNGDVVNILLNRGTYRQVGSLTPGQLQIADRRYTLQRDISKSAASCARHGWIG
jgi:hypothetical protein